MLLMPFTAQAALTTTPTTMQPQDSGVLYSYLSASATSIAISPIYKWVDGVRTSGCFNTGSGFVLIEDGTKRYEYASFSGNACSSGQVTTLSGIRRGLSTTTASFTAGTGMAWDAGSRVRVIDYPLIYNQKANKDTANQFTASGAISFSGSGSFELPKVYDATIRDIQFKSPREGQLAYITGTNQVQIYSGGAWVQFSSGSTVNAGYANSGKVECATPSELAAGTASGSTNAPLVACGQEYTVGTTASGHVVVTNPSGKVAPAILGTGTPSSTTFLRGDGAWNDSVSTFDNIFGSGAITTQAFTGATALVATKQYNFTGAVIDAADVITTASGNDLLMIRFKGDVTLNGTINLDSKGALGGAAGLLAVNGANGSAGKSLTSIYTTGGGVGGTAGGTAANGGGGGASITAAGTSPEVTDTASPDIAIGAFLANGFSNAVCGGGGGGGASQDSSDGGGIGGKGGGCMLMFVKGNLTLGAASVIDCDGANGAGGLTTNDGGGGGGGGGACFIFVGGRITNGGVTISANKGSGGGNGAGDGGEGIACIVGINDRTLICAQ